MLAIPGAPILLPHDVDGGQEAFIVLAGLNFDKVAGLQIRRLDGVAHLQEVRGIVALEIQNTVIVRLQYDLVLEDAAQHARGTLQLGGLLVLLVTPRNGEAYAAVTGRILSRILAGVLTGRRQRGFDQNQREKKPKGTNGHIDTRIAYVD